MLKYLINLLATATSFVALILVVSLFVATPQTSDSQTKDIFSSPLQPISLNVASPALKIVPEHTNVSALGCTCAICTQVGNRAI